MMAPPLRVSRQAILLVSAVTSGFRLLGMRAVVCLSSMGAAVCLSSMGANALHGGQ